MSQCLLRVKHEVEASSRVGNCDGHQTLIDTPRIYKFRHSWASAGDPIVTVLKMFTLYVVNAKRYLCHVTCRKNTIDACSSIKPYD